MGAGTRPALLRAESLLLFESHPSLHLPTLGKEGPYQGRCVFHRGPFLKEAGGTSKLWLQKARVMPFLQRLLDPNLGEARFLPPFTLFVLVCAGMPRFSKCLSDWHFLNMYSDGLIRSQASGFAGSRPAGSLGARHPAHARLKPQRLLPGLLWNRICTFLGSYFPNFVSVTGGKIRRLDAPCLLPHLCTHPHDSARVTQMAESTG